MEPLRAQSPLPPDGCNVTVVIPARNEANTIERTLEALGRQVGFGGGALPENAFETIVFANNCVDGTATIARKWAAARPHMRVHVLERRLDAAQAHIGGARKAAMDLAAKRFVVAGKVEGLIASLDADTIVDPGWIAATLAEAQKADAVAGHVELAARDCVRLIAPVRLLYARERSYRRLLAEVEATLDPVPEDPWPRHSSFVGASFAVKAGVYTAAGGIPPLSCLEDQHFLNALRRIDARIRHSPLVRATTSARTDARVTGGFGTFLAALHDHARRGESFRVEHPQGSLRTFARRAGLRSRWEARRDAIKEPGRFPAGHAQAQAPNGDTGQDPTFGAYYERITRLEGHANLPDVSVEIAIEALHAALATLRAGDFADRNAAGLG